MGLTIEQTAEYRGSTPLNQLSVVRSQRSTPAPEGCKFDVFCEPPFWGRLRRPHVFRVSSTYCPFGATYRTSAQQSNALD